MKKWCIILLVFSMQVGAQALDVTITCEETAGQVGIELTWEASLSKGYRLYACTDLIFGDWTNWTDRVPVMGLFETNLPHAEYYFRVEERELVPPHDGMVLVLPGENSGTDPDFGAYALTVGRFWMDTVETSWTQWSNVIGWATNNSYSFPNSFAEALGPDHPVLGIRWIEAALYCNAKSEMEGRTPCYYWGEEVLRTYNFVDGIVVSCDFEVDGYRLPTNDEWEYVARGGVSGTRFWWGDTISHANANYTGGKDYPGISYDESKGPHPDYLYFDGTRNTAGTAPVGDLPTNAYGIYNILGNVGEFTMPVSGELGMVSGTDAVVRGGSYGGGSWATELRCGDKSQTGGWMTAGYTGNTDAGIRTVVGAFN